MKYKNQEQEDLAVDALCANYGYSETIDDEPNPETKKQFHDRMLVEFVENNIEKYRTDNAIETARDIAIESAKTEAGGIMA
jgi:hypothetical protein